MIRFLAPVLTRVMNSGVQITPVVCSSLRSSMETGIELISLFAKCLDTTHNNSREPRLPQPEDMPPWALNATLNRGFQSQMQNLDTNYGNFHRHLDRQGKFKTLSLSTLAITTPAFCSSHFLLHIPFAISSLYSPRHFLAIKLPGVSPSVK